MNQGEDKVVRILSGQNSGSFSESDIHCALGRDVLINFEPFEGLGGRSLTATESDLLMLISVVAFADRKVSRSRLSWSRQIHIDLSVFDPKFWAGQEILKSLTDTLQFLTGDLWSFNFRGHKNNGDFLTSSGQSPLPLPEEFPVVLPFSHGLDSFIESARLKKLFPRQNQMKVTVVNQNVGSYPFEVLGRERLLRIPFTIPRLEHAESSYRTRPFGFFVMAALAAKMVGAGQIVIPENGQGTIGAIIIRSGNEWPYRGTHPGFTRRLSGFLSNVIQHSIKFEHPNLWKTKGQMLKELIALDAASGWENTTSCSRDARYSSAGGRRVPCGVCGGCLLRRVSLYAGRVDSESEQYLWNDLNTDTMDASLIGSLSSKNRNRNDRNIAVTAIVSMNQLARYSNASDKGVLIQLADLGELDGSDQQEKEGRLIELVECHAEEWRGFLSQLKKGSWVHSHCLEN